MLPSPFQNLQILSLADHPRFFQATLRLIEASFAYQIPHHFDVDFAPLLHQGNLQHSHLLMRGEKVVGHVGIMPRTLGKMALPVGLIGGVCLSEEERGKGLFRFFFENILGRYSSRVALFFLWGDQVDLYKKFHFHLAIGQMERAPFNDIPPTEEGWVKQSFAALTEKNRREIRAIYEEETQSLYTTLGREDFHWENIKKINSSELFIKKNGQQEIESYFFMGKGQDLARVIHEVGYRKGLRNQVLQGLGWGHLWLPEEEQAFFAKNEPPVAIHYMALVRMGNPSLFAQLVSQWSGGKITIISAGEKEVRFLLENKEYLETFENFLIHLWGPRKKADWGRPGPPLFISGLDSI